MKKVLTESLDIMIWRKKLKNMGMMEAIAAVMVVEDMVREVTRTQQAHQLPVTKSVTDW